MYERFKQEFEAHTTTRICNCLVVGHRICNISHEQTESKVVTNVKRTLKLLLNLNQKTANSSPRKSTGDENKKKRAL